MSAGSNGLAPLAQGRPRPPAHPMATLSVVLSVLGFFALPVIGGLVGALLAAVALRATSREPQRWSGRGRARIGLALGMVNGVAMFTVFALVRHDDWGSGPLVAVVIYAAVLGALVGSTRSPRGALWGGALAGGGTLAVAAVVIATVLAVAFMLRMIARELLCALDPRCTAAVGS